MKPKLITETKVLKTQYWRCSEPDHRHQSVGAAGNCMLRTEARKQRARDAMQAQRDPNDTDLRIVVAALKAGISLSDVAVALRLRMTSLAFFAKAVSGEAVGDGKVILSTRTRNVLSAEFGGDFSVDQVAACTENDLLKTSNLGRKSLNEVMAWLAFFGRSLADGRGGA